MLEVHRQVHRQCEVAVESYLGINVENHGAQRPIEFVDGAAVLRALRGALRVLETPINRFSGNLAAGLEELEAGAEVEVVGIIALDGSELNGIVCVGDICDLGGPQWANEHEESCGGGGGGGD